MHLLAFFDFLTKGLMFPQIIRSTQLDAPCLFVFSKKILQGACADVFTRPTLINNVGSVCMGLKSSYVFHLFQRAHQLLTLLGFDIML